MRTRIDNLVREFKGRFHGTEAGVRLFSCPGRSEIGGNHTDHNCGKVLGASINLDCIAAVQQADSLVVISDGVFNEDYTVDTASPLEPSAFLPEKGSRALVAGVAAALKKNGRKVGGFNARLSSDIPTGAGLSSSAAFEMLVGQIFNALYNNGEISVPELARAGQFAENVYWRKSSGLLDQMACGTGGLAAMDFADPSAPVVEKIPFDFAATGYSLILVNAGGSHAGLDAEYSAIPAEMKSVAAFFGREVLRGVSRQELGANAASIRQSCGDRAFLRAVHFVEENARVDRMVSSLKAGDFSDFLQIAQASGDSSFRFLQNVSHGRPEEQPIPVALALSELFFSENQLPRGKTAARVHGGGFAGIIQVYLPRKLTLDYKAWMDRALGPASGGQARVFEMSVRKEGVVELV
jgi:galactokinase